jgi:hypothetical protein
MKNLDVSHFPLSFLTKAIKFGKAPSTKARDEALQQAGEILQDLIDNWSIGGDSNYDFHNRVRAFADSLQRGEINAEPSAKPQRYLVIDQYVTYGNKSLFVKDVCLNPDGSGYISCRHLAASLYNTTFHFDNNKELFGSPAEEEFGLVLIQLAIRTYAK